ncbi:hypothetical protein M9Y10_010286 [Tritrichomonas musculus]|uniref:Uncharacterized protein n=1 Tax=Tritrichomonas musculus TaxID=1915356 RepID=A0ABR2IK89_9EUKA
MYSIFRCLCGRYYTSYLVSDPENSTKFQPANFSKDTSSKLQFPIILNTENASPIVIFGSNPYSAAIDCKGGVILINNEIIKK